MLTVGSLFAGVGGLELGLEQTGGFKTIWSNEINRQCNEVRRRNRIGGIIYEEPIQEFLPRVIAGEVEGPGILCGGDPCPRHSGARFGQVSTSPDLSGYFLAVAGRLRTEWLVRENVLAPNVAHFAAALEAIGYGCVVVRMDAAGYTGQARTRDFIVGHYQAPSASVGEVFLQQESSLWDGPTIKEVRAVAGCLTASNAYRGGLCEIPVWEEGGRLRWLDCDEREALAGFPPGWTAGFSKTARARMCGNAVAPACARWIGEQILEHRRQAAKGAGG